MKKITVQLIIACFLVLVGSASLIIGLLTHPIGVIDSSVLVAFGEACTFAGAILGVDYNYRLKLKLKTDDPEE